jgi:hypothetical protein
VDVEAGDATVARFYGRYVALLPDDRRMAP